MTTPRDGSPIWRSREASLGRALHRWFCGLRAAIQPVSLATAAVTIVPAVVASIGFFVPQVQDALRRDPHALVAGQWWRLFSPLLVRTDGWLPLVAVLLATLVAGVVVEPRLGPVRTLALYLTAGVVGQAAGYLWDPTGAGSSVGMLGLFGGVWAGLLTPSFRVDGPVRVIGVIGVSLLAALVGGAIALGSPLLSILLAGLVGGLGIQVVQRRAGRAVDFALVGGALLAAVLLTVLHDNHGPAVLAGLAAAGLLERRAPHGAS